MYHMAYDTLEEDLKKGNKTRRKICKPAVLGCGFGLGKGEERYNKKTGEMEASGLLGYARSMGIDLTPDQCELSVETFRSTYTGVTDFWKEAERAALQAVRTGKEQCLDKISFDYQKPFLRMNLPMGGYLHYLRPEVEKQMKPWGKKKWTLTYEGMRPNRTWGKVSTHPGKITENAVQKIARDLLRDAKRRINELGWPINMHVHDEVISQVRLRDAERAYREIQQCMVASNWCPDMPVQAAGYISPWFVKD